jgi:hypothetical protein
METIRRLAPSNVGLYLSGNISIDDFSCMALFSSGFAATRLHPNVTKDTKIIEDRDLLEEKSPSTGSEQIHFILGCGSPYRGGDT